MIFMKVGSMMNLKMIIKKNNSLNKKILLTIGKIMIVKEMIVYKTNIFLKNLP